MGGEAGGEAADGVGDGIGDGTDDVLDCEVCDGTGDWVDGEVGELARTVESLSAFWGSAGGRTARKTPGGQPMYGKGRMLVEGVAIRAGVGS